MKITKFVHSCLLVEMPAPVSRTALFDPGIMSEAALDITKLTYLDDIIYTHGHSDHLSIPLLKQLVARFPRVHITAPTEVVDVLAGEGITASDQPSEGIVLFDSPHAVIRPYFDSDPPQQIGVHYLGLLSDPGDSHAFSETKAVLALPVQAPWGSVRDATALALELRPQYIVPVHDWHWNDEARNQAYGKLESLFGEQGITFIRPRTGKSFVLDV